MRSLNKFAAGYFQCERQRLKASSRSNAGNQKGVLREVRNGHHEDGGRRRRYCRHQLCHRGFSASAAPNIQGFGTSEPLIVTPQVRDFSARGPNGQTYKLVDNVEVPNGLNPAPIVQGSDSRGTLCFDATGAPPNGIV